MCAVIHREALYHRLNQTLQSHKKKNNNDQTQYMCRNQIKLPEIIYNYQIKKRLDSFDTFYKKII